MSNKKIVIVGAGIAGLSVGCYLQMNGFKTHILEMNNQPGGVCSAWERDGYVFDGCLDYLEGTGPGYVLNKVLNEIGAFDSTRVFEYEVYKEIEYSQGKTIKVYADADKLRDEMLKISDSQVDKALIEEFIDAVKLYGKEQLPIAKPPEISNIKDFAKLLFYNFKFLRLFNKWRRLSVKNYAQRFENDDLRNVFRRILRNERMSIMILISMLGSMNIKSCGFPYGGSMAVSRNIEKRYIELGGIVDYGRKVARVDVEGNVARGVLMDDDSTIEADIVISAADGYFTIFKMLEGKYADDKLRADYERMPLHDPIIQVFFGVQGEYADLPHFINFPLKDSFKIDAVNEVKEMGLRIFNFDPTLAPKGNTVFSVMFETEFEYWNNMYEKDFDVYKAEKSRIANQVIDCIGQKYSWFKENVKEMNVVTPITYFKNLNSWRGSCRAWLPIAQKTSLKFRKKLPGLRNFYMTGQWVEGEGGVSNIVLASRQLAQVICHAEEKEFRTLSVDENKRSLSFNM